MNLSINYISSFLVTIKNLDKRKIMCYTLYIKSITKKIDGCLWFQAADGIDLKNLKQVLLKVILKNWKLI